MPPRERAPLTLANEIREWIAARDFKTGDRLPSEQHLAAELHTSRPTLRRAMIVLEINGEIEIRSGAGAYITGYPKTISLLVGASPGFRELIHARALIESSAAAEAAALATTADLADLGRLIAAAGLAVSAPERTSLDSRFHLRIAEASKNTSLHKIIAELLRSTAETPEQSEWMNSAGAHDVGSHQAILEALKERSPAKARNAMRCHVLRREEYLMVRSSIASAGVHRRLAPLAATGA